MLQETTEPAVSRYLLTLFVTGATVQSSQAIAGLKAFCEQHLEGRYALEVVDVYQQPARAHVERVLATPTLIKKLPLPLKRMVGDLSDQRLLSELDVPPGI
jgi:circadian clock protein KaiB